MIRDDCGLLPVKELFLVRERSPEGVGTDDAVELSTWRPRRLHIRPNPCQMKRPISFVSFTKFSSHHFERTVNALKNRKGSIVNEYNHASRHANVPNHRTCSSCGASSRKFTRRSKVTLEDSYGKSLVTERWIYRGDGLSEDSSSWRYVGSDSGGNGIEVGIGDAARSGDLGGLRPPGPVGVRGSSTSIFSGVGIARPDLGWLDAPCALEIALFERFDLRFGGVDTVRGDNVGLGGSAALESGSAATDIEGDIRVSATFGNAGPTTALPDLSLPCILPSLAACPLTLDGGMGQLSSSNCASESEGKGRDAGDEVSS